MAQYNKFDPDFDENYEVEKRLSRYLKAAFSNDDKFRYTDDMKTRTLNVCVEFPEVTKETPFFVPCIVISGIQSRINPNQTLFSNFFRDIYDEDGNILYQDQLYSYVFSVTMFCVTESSATCKTLTSKVQRKLAIWDIHKLGSFGNLNIESEIATGPPAMRQQFPSRVWEAPISFQGRMLCIFRRKYGSDFNQYIDCELHDVQVNTIIEKNKK